MTIDAKGLRAKAVRLWRYTYEEGDSYYGEERGCGRPEGYAEGRWLPADLAEAVLACVEAAVNNYEVERGVDCDDLEALGTASSRLCQAVEAVLSRLDAAGGA